MGQGDYTMARLVGRDCMGWSPRNLSSLALNASFEGALTTSSGSLFHRGTTLWVKKLALRMVRGRGLEKFFEFPCK